MTVIILYIGWLSKTTQTKREEKKKNFKPQTVQIMFTFSLSFEHLLKLFMCVSVLVLVRNRSKITVCALRIMKYRFKWPSIYYLS